MKELCSKSLMPHIKPVVGLTIIIAVLVVLCCCDIVRPVKFDKAQWLKARAEEDWSTRRGMAKDIINRRSEFVGKSREDIISQFGNPEGDPTANELDYKTLETWDVIDPDKTEHLVFKLDQNGRVSSIEIFKWKRY